MVIIIITSMASTAGNESSGGGDWFVRTLPLIKIKLPEDFGVVEGVQYKKVGLPRCNEQELERLKVKSNIPDTVNIINLPDRNWNVIQVMIENGKQMICSLGPIDVDPTLTLKTLVDNEDTNRTLYFEDGNLGRQIKYSKNQGTVSKFSFSSSHTMGTFLVHHEPKGVYIGYNLQDGLGVLGFPRSLYFKTTQEIHDFVYIPLSIQDHTKTYFVQTVIDNTQNSVWRLVIPIALNSKDLPIASLAQAIRESKENHVWDFFYPVKFDLYREQKFTKLQIWTRGKQTPTSELLRKQLIQKFGVNEVGAMFDPDLLKPQFNVSYIPSIEKSQLNHAAFHRGDNGNEIILPIVTQAWRIGADVVHELTHALQVPCGPDCTDDRLFEMEMEAHTNERQHLKEIIELFPAAKYASDAFNYLVAASLPKVTWVDQLQKPLEQSLCVDVILNYQLDPEKIQTKTMKKFNCQFQLKNLKSTSRRKI